jgi:uncharacterized membrane protein YfhO
MQPGLVDLSILSYEEHSVRVHYSSPGAALLRFSIPYAPGWSAVVDGTPSPVVPMDYAFVGVQVPSGAHDLLLEYRLPGFAVGAVTSVAGLVVLGAVVIFPSRRRDKP